MITVVGLCIRADQTWAARTKAAFACGFASSSGVARRIICRPLSLWRGGGVITRSWRVVLRLAIAADSSVLELRQPASPSDSYTIELEVWRAPVSKPALRDE